MLPFGEPQDEWAIELVQNFAAAGAESGNESHPSHYQAQPVPERYAIRAAKMSFTGII
jgi:hypothetical protein